MIVRREERFLGALTFPEVARKLKPTSILCLPLGAMEQHGAHLPLATDVVVAEGVARALLARFGEEFDLWRLPTLPIGLSREHDWAAGTLSLSVQTFAALIKDVAREIARSLPARNLVFINGHGGNRGILENLLHEVSGDHGLNACVIHPLDLAQTSAGDIHGGAAETSLMLALAPDLVRTERIAGAPPAQAAETMATLIFDRAVTFPWRTDDPRLAQNGIIGDPRSASAEHGRAMLERMVEGAGAVFARLLDNQAFMGKALR